MRYGVVFPQTEIGTDPAAIRDYAQAAEGLGYSQILTYEHVLGASSERYPNLSGPYRERHQFHEPFVLFGYMAAFTQRIELVMGVLVLPMRQTVLVAKQSAALDVLCRGRLRLGVGVGWNPVEAEAMGTDFHTRGKRIEEQIDLLRKLWTEPLVDFEGQWHRVSGAGINPLPIQRPIPIWAGATADAGLQRAARLADGWFPLIPPDQRARDQVAKVRGYLQAAGRDPNAFGIEARAYLKEWNPDRLHQQVQFWRDLGATHLDMSTMGMGLASPQEHITMIERLRKELE